MKNPLQTLVLAGVVAIAASSAAFAGGNPQLMGQRSWEYWNQQHKAEADKLSGMRQASDSNAGQATQYPCPNCTYDQQTGGYVQKPYGKK